MRLHVGYGCEELGYSPSLPVLFALADALRSKQNHMEITEHKVVWPLLATVIMNTQVIA